MLDISSFGYTTNLAVRALIKEAQLAPKPGLVDSADNGSHKDMDLPLFIVSANALTPSFKEYLLLGYNHVGDKKELLAKCRSVGMIAEKAMFHATGGVNTHKGANFSFGLLLAAMGSYRADNQVSKFSVADIEKIFDIIKDMARDIVADDFKDLDKKEKLTYGENLYNKYNFAGIRLEAQEGYPNIIGLALPRLMEIKMLGLSENQIYLEILYLLISKADDSNIVSRGGFEGLEYVKETASDFLNSGGVTNPNYLQNLKRINSEFIKRNLSPGGSADLLSMVIFIDLLLESF